MSYYWGPKDTSVTFCEDKYTHIYWVAEYFNTISSFSYIIIGTLYFKGILSVGIISVGIGSILLHGTLRWYGQWIDEIAMLCTITFAIEKFKSKAPINLPVLIFFYICFHNYFIFLSTIFVSLNFYLCYITRNVFYIIFTILGSICWLSDQLFCEDVKDYYLHAWWHIFTSLAPLTLLMINYYSIIYIPS